MTKNQKTAAYTVAACAATALIVKTVAETRKMKKQDELSEALWTEMTAPTN